MALLSTRGSSGRTRRPAGASGTPPAGVADERRTRGRHRGMDWALAWLAVAPGTPAWGRGLRLAAAMIVPLAAGVIVGRPTPGLLVGVGAFVVASTDTGGPYRPRAATMAAATLGVTAAYFLGALTAAPRWLSVLLFVSVLAGSALIGTVGPRVALVSTMVTVAFVIGAFLPSSLAADARAALALLAGGGWALGLSLAGWPFDRRRPERRAVSAAISSCAAFLGELDPAGGEAVSSGPGAREAARKSLGAARQALQASLPRGRSRMAPEVRRLWALLHATGTLFDAIVAAGRQLPAAGRRGCHPVPPAATLTAMRRLDDAVQALIAVLTGPVPGPRWMPARASDQRWHAVVRAVRQPSPAVLRGAVRQATAGGIALVVASLFDPAHGAWLVSSTVLVLKPNVSGTVSTAAQRAAATVVGATISAGIVAVTSNQPTLIAISFAVAALAMAFMPLSYSLGILIITPLSILLTAVLTGSGWLIAVSRIENILIGVAIAVVVSCLLFPTWLRTSVPGLVTGTIDAIRRYLAMVRLPREPEAGNKRAEGKALHEARSDAETAVASLRATAGQLGLEPGSGALARGLGDASAAAGEVLDAIIALKQVLDRDGTGRESSRESQPVMLGYVVAELTDAVASLGRVLGGLSSGATVSLERAGRLAETVASGRGDALPAAPGRRVHLPERLGK